MQVLLSVSIALFVGLLMTRVLKALHLKLPDVTAFLIAGILVGPYVLGRLNISGLGFTSIEEVEQVSVLCTVALGFIAFDIGNEFRLAHLKQIGKTATVVGIFQAVVTTLIVDAVLISLHFILGEDVLPLPVAITLGAIASATAPAATLMVVRQFKAKGPVTDILLPVVALDDAVGLIVFAISIGIAQAIQGGALNLISIVLNPLIEIIGSLILGAVMGVILTKLEQIFFSNKNRLSLTISFVILTIALSMIKIEFNNGVHVGFSSLLVCMMLGTVFCNMSEYSVDIMEHSERWTAPLYTVFFVLSGAELELSVFVYPMILLIGVVYILSRCLGKYLGAWASACMMHCDDNIKKYLGVTLFPQAGVALGMVTLAQCLGEQMGAMIRNIILFSVLIYELVGPLLTKEVLKKAGEITPKEASHVHRARHSKKQH